MQMYTYFWCGVEIDDFIFKGINISNWQGMLITCVGTAFFAFLLLVVTFSKEMLQHSSFGQRQGQAFLGGAQILQVWTSSWRLHTLQTISSLIQFTLGYLIMLIVMSFNVYLICSVLVGSISGYFLLNPLLLKKRSISSKLPNNRQHNCEPCHADECGSLINGQDDQTPTGTPLTNSTSGDSSINKVCIVSAIHSPPTPSLNN